ncbi:hypothetical protein K443DRAFT_507892 [Laccaria amethystina LaAM-08-1]|uniref:Uncharacterized protein n=1 Tax=Laccaria amethystina LaAM-08-1 TaxID=1095629 RepID=A0A0C9XMR9_9AGAR|nr:hypothetical protein K443DRAFT_507892 [Laccaria amethystina LaAM-08-1]
MQTVRCESESYSGGEIEGLTGKVFGRNFDLVRMNWLFSEYCEPKLHMPRNPANLGFRPRMLAAAKRCRFESRCLMSRQESTISRGLVARVGSVM